MVKRDDNKSKFSLAGKAILMTAGLLAGFIIGRIFITPYTVQNESMLPGLAPGDTVFILKTSTPKRGDIILFQSPVQNSRVMLKRVTAVENETIEIRNQVIYINNKLFAPPWKTKKSKGRILPMTFTGRDSIPTVKIGNDELFVMGDNQGKSYDSREFGPVKRNLVIGTVLYKF